MTEEKKKRGFAVMDPHLVRAIARKGGKAAHEQGTAHRFTSEEARIAGAKGGAQKALKAAAVAEASTEAEPVEQ